MATFRQAAALVLTAMLVAPVAALADDTNAPYSSAATLMPLCGSGTDASPLATDFCKANSHDALTVKLDEAIRAVAPKAPANVRPLLKRDQASLLRDGGDGGSPRPRKRKTSPTGFPLI